jgi:transcriptional regulator with XRE-family HTH domain
MEHAKKYISNQISAQLHIGNMLKDLFKKRRIHKSALARKLNRAPDTIYRYQKQSTIQIAIMWELSEALKHNFFRDIAALLPADYASNAPQETSQAEQIEALSKQVMLLTAERDFALKLLGKK